MPELFERTVARRLEQLERLIRDLSTREVGYSMADAIGTLMCFPELRGLWPFSSVNESGNAIDFSGQDRTLNNTGAASRTLANNIVPYAAYNGATKYYSRADEAGLDITTNLTVGGWFYFDAVAASSCITKYNTTGNQRSFWLGQVAGGAARFLASTDGASNVHIDSAADALPAVKWIFMAGRFINSTSIDLYVNRVKYTSTTAIPASIFNSTAALMIGGQNAAANLAGRSALCFLAASAVPDKLIYRFYDISRTLLAV